MIGKKIPGGRRRVGEFVRRIAGGHAVEPLARLGDEGANELHIAGRGGLGGGDALRPSAVVDAISTRSSSGSSDSNRLFSNRNVAGAM